MITKRIEEARLRWNTLTEIEKGKAEVINRIIKNVEKGIKGFEMDYKFDGKKIIKDKIIIDRVELIKLIEEKN